MLIHRLLQVGWRAHWYQEASGHIVQGVGLEGQLLYFVCGGHRQRGRRGKDVSGLREGCSVTSLSGSCPLQGQHYHTYELAKNTEPEKEEEEEFQAALAVHPVSDMTLMYRLHKHFSRIQLDRTYQEIQDLQVCGEGCPQKLLGQAGFLFFQQSEGRLLLLLVGDSRPDAGYSPVSQK